MRPAHGPWCEVLGDGSGICRACRELYFPPAPDVGLWLLLRLAAHHFYNRTIPKNRQAPLDLFELNGADWMEVTRLRIAIVRAAHPEKVREVW